MGKLNQKLKNKVLKTGLIFKKRLDFKEFHLNIQQF